MDNKLDIQDGWADPDDPAKLITGSLKRKSVTLEVETQDALDDKSRYITLSS